MTREIGRNKSWRRIAGAFGLAVCLGALPVLAAQNPQDQPPAAAQPSPQQAGGTFNPGGNPQGQPPAYPVAPPSLTVPAGTVISVRVAQWLSSDHSRPGDQFNAVLDQPVIVDGWVVAQPGQTVMGRVAVAQKAGHGQKESQLGVELSQLVLVDGQQVPLRTQLLQASGPGVPTGQQVATVGIPTGLGAAIGAAAAGGQGAGIGAAAGATAGLIGVLLTHGKPTVIPPGTLMTFRQEYPLTISTVRSAQAFQPVSQPNYAYSGNTLQYQPQPNQAYVAPGYPPAPNPYYWDYYGYGYPYWGWGYPWLGFGFYGAYGYGPRVFVGPRYGGFAGRGFGGGGFGGRGGGFGGRGGGFGGHGGGGHR